MNKVLVSALALGLGTSAFGQTISVWADQDANGNGGVTPGSGNTATVQPGGFRTAPNGARFFNVEGGNNGNFSSYGAIQFNLADLYTGIAADVAAHGGSGFNVTGVRLALTESNAAFSVAGFVNISATSVTDGNIDPYSAAHLPLTCTLGLYNGGMGTLTGLGHVFFGDTNTGDKDVGDISGAAAALNAQQAFLTLVLEASNPGIAATWKGQDAPFGGLYGPELQVDYTVVPTPGSAALLMGAGLLAVGRRRTGR